MTSGIKCTFEKQETMQRSCRFIRGRRLGGDGGARWIGIYSTESIPRNPEVKHETRHGETCRAFSAWRREGRRDGTIAFGSHQPEGASTDRVISPSQDTTADRCLRTLRRRFRAWKDYLCTHRLASPHAFLAAHVKLRPRRNTVLIEPSDKLPVTVFILAEKRLLCVSIASGFQRSRKTAG